MNAIDTRIAALSTEARTALSAQLEEAAAHQRLDALLPVLLDALAWLAETLRTSTEPLNAPPVSRRRYLFLRLLQAAEPTPEKAAAEAIAVALLTQARGAEMRLYYELLKEQPTLPKAIGHELMEGRDFAERYAAYLFCVTHGVALAAEVSGLSAQALTLVAALEKRAQDPTGTCMRPMPTHTSPPRACLHCSTAMTARASARVWQRRSRVPSRW